jgi:dienelactone hydrolase
LIVVSQSIDRFVLCAIAVACFGFDINARAVEDRTDPPGKIVMRKAIVYRPEGGGGRSRGRSIGVDPVVSAIVSGTWKTPAAGDSIKLADGSEARFQAIDAKPDGSIAGREIRGGYAIWTFDSAEAGVKILEASGHDVVYANGSPRVGDVYSYGYVHLPVPIRVGRNEFVFHAARGDLRAELKAPRSIAQLDLSDPTLPDIVIGESEPVWAAILVEAASIEPVTGLTLVAKAAGGGETRTNLPKLIPCSTRKVAFRIDPGERVREEQFGVELKLIRLKADGGEEALDSTELKLSVRSPSHTYKRTFISKIDGSAQYYGVNPPSGVDPWASNGPRLGSPRPALFLTLHGASVEAIGQANAYSSKSWGYLIAPTNRRPYGFDWEDVGRADAIEVLDLALKRYATDPSRTYLTGHSMGGHGTWHVGATFPDRFAAIAPSAGWISFWSYAGGRPTDDADPIQKMIRRSQSQSDTLALIDNYADLGVYILHGSADDNVPANQAREMNKRLGEFHRDFRYHEQPGAGHWWDSSDEPGADCVDWAPMFDFFARRVIPRYEQIRHIKFRTANPGISSRSFWASIESQIRPLEIASIDVRVDPASRRFVGSTVNVRRLAIDAAVLAPGAPFGVELDGTKIESIARPKNAQTKLWLMRESADRSPWRTIDPPSPNLKGPRRYGPFKEAFQNRFMFVYGTRGNDDENAWALAKARFDAEVFWYRGNASIDVVADSEFDPERDRDRNVILYGNSETNGAWKALLASSPVQVDRSAVRIGDRTIPGSDNACLFIQPRPGSEVASVGVVAGTGIAGSRATDRVPYQSSGTGYPDCLVLSAKAFSRGAAGILAAGFFGDDWSVNTGEFVYREERVEAKAGE